MPTMWSMRPLASSSARMVVAHMAIPLAEAPQVPVKTPREESASLMRPPQHACHCPSTLRAFHNSTSCLVSGL